MNTKDLSFSDMQEIVHRGEKIKAADLIAGKECNLKAKTMNDSVETQIGVDKSGNFVHVRHLDVNIDRGLACGLYHIKDGTPLQATALNSKKTIPYLRRDFDNKRNGIKGQSNESLLHKIVIKYFEQIDEVCGIALTEYRANQRISVKINNKEVQSYTADVLFNECAVEVILSHEIDYQKRMFYEGIKLPIVTVRYPDEDRYHDTKANEYLTMSEEDVIFDILAHCTVQLPYREILEAKHSRQLAELNEGFEENNQLLLIKIKQIEDAHKTNMAKEKDRNSITGRILSISEEMQIGKARKRDIVVETLGAYPSKVVIQAWGKILKVVSGLDVGQRITAFFNATSTKSGERFYTNLNAYMIKKIS